MHLEPRSTGLFADSASLTKVISIPSHTEVLTYYPEDTAKAERIRKATDYAKLNGVQINTAGAGYWWTRSRSTSNPIRVGHAGTIDSMATGHFSSAGLVLQIYISK